MRSVGICDGSTEAELLTAQLDRIADLRSVMGTAGPCDAVSLGVGFTATTVRLGGAAEGAMASTLCP